jgi:hypothetical protein
VEYLSDVIGDFGEWLRYADTKAAGVLVVLGFGIVDLFNHASKLTHARALPSGWGDVATTAY